MEMHSVNGVRDAASVLGLVSFVGPLTDMTLKLKEVDQSFDHSRLRTAREELKHCLRVGRFEAQHVYLARELLDRIKSLQRTRQNRDRMRECSREKNQAKQAAAREQREREESEKRMAEQQLRDLRERLAKATRTASRAIGQAKKAKEANRLLVEGVTGADGEQARTRLSRACKGKEPSQQQEARRPTVLDYRGSAAYKLDIVEVAPSSIHGHGVMTTRRVAEGAEVFRVDLPDCGEEQGYTPDMYNDYIHIAHKDGQSAALIDFGATVEGTLLACYEDVKAGYIRAMNHARGEPGANVILDVRDESKPDWYFPAGGVEYTIWYCCHVIATRTIERGEELRFEYACVPESWG